MTNARPAGRYGIDAPWVPWLWVAFGVAYLVIAAGNLWWWGSVSGAGDVTIEVATVVVALLFLACAALYWNATLRGKFLVWDEILAGEPAPRRVLDMGCGHGAVSIMTAMRFSAARVDGVDLWRGIDQSGNSADAAQANAAANGVADRVTFATGDMTSLPHADGSFDLVTASMAIHNIHSPAGRITAVDEAWRVLRPGGRLVIADISKTREYERRLRALGARTMTVHPAGWRMWWSGPWMSTRILRAVKHQPPPTA